jgi:uncharacterized protein
VKYRNENGPFPSREALKKVPRLGDKAFEQAAGFLRILDAKNPLDRSAVHPERYKTVEQMAKELQASIQDLMTKAELRKQINLNQYVSDEVGLPTLKDIMAELDRPGRDPRDQFEVVTFAEGVNDIKDLKVGMSLPGVVTNITKFGAFVDLGVHQDGLVHISHLSDQFVSDPAQAVKLGQKVNVRVLEVDVSRKRISLSMKTDAPAPGKKEERSRTKPSVQANKDKQHLKKEFKPRQQEERLPDGDLQAKLAALKGKFGG